jgi:hypothetical protein
MADLSCVFTVEIDASKTVHTIFMHTRWQSLLLARSQFDEHPIAASSRKRPPIKGGLHDRY